MAMSKKTPSLTVLSIFVLAGLVALSGCDLFTGTAGRITIKLKDAPFPYDYVSEVNVTVNRVEVLGVSANRNWLVADIAQNLNLMQLRDGKTATLVPDVEIPAGKYDRLRIFIKRNATVVLTDGREFSVNHAADLPDTLRIPTFEFKHGDDEAEVLLDFDVESSFTAKMSPDDSTITGIQGFAFTPKLVTESLRLNNETLPVPAQ